MSPQGLLKIRISLAGDKIREPTTCTFIMSFLKYFT